MGSLPYSTATAGQKALDELRAMLRAHGCQRIAVLEDYEDRRVGLQFVHDGRAVNLSVSLEAYAKRLMAQPRPPKGATWTRERAQAQASIAVWSILRDQVKSGLQMVDAGLVDFGQVFLPYLVTSSGRTVLESIEAGEFPALPPPPDGPT